MKHIKIFEEELTEFTKDVFDLNTKIELFYFDGNNSFNLEDILQNFLTLAKEAGAKIMVKNIDKKDQIKRIIFLAEGKYSIEEILFWFSTIDNYSSNKINSVGLEANNTIIGIRWDEGKKILFKVPDEAPENI